MRTGVIVMICMVLCACGKTPEPAPTAAPSVVEVEPTPMPDEPIPAPLEPLPPSKPEFTPVTRLLQHSAPIRRIIALPGGKEILTSAPDGILRWKVKNWSLAGPLSLGDAYYVRDYLAPVPSTGRLISVAPDGMSIESATPTGTVQLEILAPITEPMNVRDIAVLPDGSALFLLEGSETVNLTRIGIMEEGKGMYVETPFTDPFLAISPSGTFIALANRRGNEVRILTAKDSQPFATIALEAVTTMAFSPDETLLVTGDGAGQVRFWDTRTYEKVQAVVPEYTGLYWSERRWRELSSLKAHDGDIRALAFSPSGVLLVSGGSDKRIQLWDTETFQLIEPAAPLEHAKPITALAFSTDGAVLISAAEDATASVWGIPSTYSGITAPTLATESDIRSRAAELEALKTKLSEKLQRIRPTREAFVSDLGATMDEVKRLKVKHNIASYAETANVPRIRNALAEIAKLQVYIDELTTMEQQFSQGIDEVTHLIKDINLDLRMLDAMEQKDFAALSSRIQAVMKRNLSTAEKSIIPQAPKLPNLERVWNALEAPAPAAPRSK